MNKLSINTSININRERLQFNIEELGNIGLNESHGLDRITFSVDDLQARQWFINKIKELKLDYQIDAAANIWTSLPNTNEKAPIIIGSHLDTVPNGGRYDGALGVLIGLEILTTLLENGITTEHPIGLVSFTAEEPNPYNLSTFGSRVVTGKLKKSDIEHVQTKEGISLKTALASAGGSVDAIETAQKKPDELAAFLEVHIEQGKRLLNQSISTGIVTAITGIYREEITFKGEANHAGTTLMKERNDALVAASKFVVAFEEIVRNHPSDEVVGTIGQFSIKPGAPNIIPNEVNLLMEIRGDKAEKIKETLQQVENVFAELANHQPIKVNRTNILDQAPTEMDKRIIETFKDAVPPEDKYLLLGSMAGHDATHLASITKAGMLFVPSIDGKSHCPEEYSRIEDIEKVANVLLQSIFKLDNLLN
ncbi:M20 family metallo-hydrolase [Lysinibacillus sp. SGAir0095]|uniref:M20 family metallo-hydrolase n=1 Tax=Lysinibacillus sp. SGAir0095 TaxID=2070463 RepID=UPI0010CCDBB4|nr:M20 family metallo-hydrolase [Lysinibacillus sp. SGAir0095]QCR32003.1 Zn-dependent hydrolase [Lysinibacillus sp. SGAir0095]